MGRTISVSPARRLVAELMVHAKRIPFVGVSKKMNLGDLIQLRQSLKSPLSWQAIFIKAYGLTTVRIPELRQAWIPYPLPRIYEHDHCEAVLPIEREWHGQSIVLAARLRAPENMSLTTIHEHLQRYKNDPIQSISSFRQLLRIGRMPWPLRRFVFSSTLYFSGFKRAKRFGTGMISSLGVFKVESIQAITAQSHYLSSGGITPEGTVIFRLTFDHRLFDGYTAAKCMLALESILQNEVKDELLSLQENQIRIDKSEFHQNNIPEGNVDHKEVA